MLVVGNTTVVTFSCLESTQVPLAATAPPFAHWSGEKLESIVRYVRHGRVILKISLTSKLAFFTWQCIVTGFNFVFLSYRRRVLRHVLSQAIFFYPAGTPPKPRRQTPDKRRATLVSQTPPRSSHSHEPHCLRALSESQSTLSRPSSTPI